jgi:hypothetical protein
MKRRSSPARPKPPPREKAAENKYSARKTTVDGIEFDSDAEARRYRELCLLERAGEITDLEMQVPYELQPRHKAGRRVIRPITYIADFRYTDTRTGEVVVEDVKGVETEVFRIKAKMMLYVHGITVRKVKMPRQDRKGRRKE